MAYLFLSFSEHLEKTTNFKNEYYNLSINEQFDLLEKRLPLEKQAYSFRDFVETCFPTGFTKKYYISCPNFLREKDQKNDNAPSYLRNVVVRPELSLRMKNYLPDNQNIILIGDIYESNKVQVLQVKGIQFIDEAMSSPNDLIVNAEACNSYTKDQSMNKAGQMVSFNVWSIDRVDKSNSLFTPNFVYDLIQNCYTIKNPEIVRKTYEDWEQYINFRKYYLDEQSKRNFKLDSAEFIDSYAVNRKDYKKNSSIYDDYILDGIADFKKGDMVVLSQKIEDAESFPLVRLNIDRNKKEFNQTKVNKRGKFVNEEERMIRSLASDNVFITLEDPNGDSKFKNKDGKTQKIQFSELLNSGYSLGDRFKIISFDILPKDHLEQLTLEYENNINKRNQAIDFKYAKIINNELEDAVKNYGNEIGFGIQNLIDQRQKELDERLDIDVKSNSDFNVLNTLRTKKKEIENKVRSSTKRDKKENDKEYNDRINKLIDELYNDIDIKSLYVKRNENEISNLRKELLDDGNIQISSYKSKKDIELKNKYKDDIRNEKIALKTKLDEKLKLDKEKVIDEETIIRFSLYFRLGDPNNAITDKQKNKIKECNYIVYDSRAEQAKIKRQENALTNFYSGYVKNPYLSSYLFNPESLSYIQPDYSNWTWYLDTLNEKQKEAVRKAVSSNGIFLLQGPPGTGKTQVIAETVAQMVKKGKKVLISSETHKAIDNVFERLPKIAEIVPIRLIPSNNKKNDNEYDPKYLVDNFYKNISSNMIKAVNRYKNFKQNKEEFSENYKKLQLLKSKISKDENILIGASKLIESLEDKAKQFNTKISNLSDKKDDIRIRLDILNRTIRHIDKNSLRPDEDIDEQLILKLREDLQALFNDNVYKETDLGNLVRNICDIKLDEIDRELVLVNPTSNKTILEIKKSELKSELDQYVDELGDIIDPSNEKKVKEIKSDLKKILNELKSQKSDIDTSSFKICSIFNYAYIVGNLDKIKTLIESLKEQIQEIKVKYINEVNLKINDVEAQLKDVENEINRYNVEVKNLNNQIIQIQDDDQVKDIQSNKNKLESDINKFFKDFEINEPYQNIDDALNIIKNKWDELEKDFAKKEKENKEKIPMYEKISKYLNMADVIEADRKQYTKELFENANVFGITCTSNDRFSGRNVESLSDYNIDDIDIKSVGIDVVIIDEVSKSSFIDLLIPILYGKTVILVGDHRQLPPMYEFSKLRDEDFEGLDENIINKDINKKITNLYEECFFKTLFEKIPDSYKTMLVQQYRCHEHIMKVFNHFYQGQLQIGFAGQNNNKKHNVRLISNGRTIIEPEKHIYFVDCKTNETHEQDSTSMYNTGEAKVVAELIRKLNDFFKKNPSQEKLSIGVICTYGDQARKIKEVLKSEKVKTDAFKTDVEKMIVSTVDDFQGDERDIIILSTVRNPINPQKSNPGFILAYQRINVALSRARRMLIMVGNRKYLEDKGVINLPDVYGKGNDRNNFRVYDEIIGTIERYGKVIDDVDVLEDKEARING